MNIENCKNLYKELSGKNNCNYKLEFKKYIKNFKSAGTCNYTRKTIYLQPAFIEKNDTKTIKGVILHEIAHALMPKHHHNKFWKRKLIEIGGDGKRCYGDEVIK